MKTITPLTLEQVRERAPSVFAEAPHSAVSEKYRYISTGQILTHLMDSGFFPVSAEQSRAREDKQGFQRHLVRLRHQDYTVSNVGDTLPEIVLQGSHDRSCAAKIMVGAFRIVCLNGLIAGDSLAGFQTRHIGQGADDLPGFLADIPSLFGRSMKTVAQWKSLELAPPEQVALAESALTLKYEIAPFAPEKLLAPRRHDDTKPDLYTTFNVIQENLLRGGQRYRTANLRRATTRRVTSVAENVRLNRSLWTLAEKMADLKAA